MQLTTQLTAIKGGWQLIISLNDVSMETADCCSADEPYPFSLPWVVTVAISPSPQTAGFQEILTEVEILAVIVGCLCHDLDHRGTNNAFQAK